MWRKKETKRKEHYAKKNEAKTSTINILPYDTILL